MSMSYDHQVQFLGICTRASPRESALDLLGLTHVHITSFFPLQFGSFYYLIGIHPDAALGDRPLDCTIEFVDTKHPETPCSSNLKFEGACAEADDIPVLKGHPEFPSGGSLLRRLPFAYVEDSEAEEPYLLFPFPAPRMAIFEPTTVRVLLRSETEKRTIGAVRFEFKRPAPLSEGERRAIAGRPAFPRAVGMSFTCSECDDNASFFSTLLPGAVIPEELVGRASRLEESGDYWKCRCGKSVIPLTYAKQGIASVFRTPTNLGQQGRELELHTLYSADEINRIAREYNQLIHRLPSEEEVQKYLEDERHALFWNFLSPIQVLRKPDIIGKHKADFGILTASNELVFVELEKPGTKLITRAGKVSSEIQQGADQIRDWDIAITTHRSAVLDRLGFNEASVHNIRYLLIGGLSTRTSHKGLVKLRREPLVPKTNFMCFDELGAYLYTLSVGLHRV